MILCCGEALIDFVPLKDETGKPLYQPCPGGSPFNTAIALGRLKVPTSFLCGLSNDFFGSMLLRHLQQSGVRTEWVSRLERDTTLAFVSADTADGEVEYAFYGRETADRSLEPVHLPDHLPKEIKILQFGSVSLVLEPTASTMELLMQRESENRLVSLDPNIRPGLIPDRDVFRVRFENWLEHTDLLKASITDLEWIFPGSEIFSIVDRILDTKKVNLVMLTSGEKGSWACSANQRVHVQAQPIEVKDAVGAGDSFHAGVLCRLSEMGVLDSVALSELKERDLKDCLGFANLIAAITCKRSGADSPTREELSF